MEMIAQQEEGGTAPEQQSLKLGFIRSDIILSLHPGVPGIRTSLEEQLRAWQQQQDDMQARAEALQNELRTAQLSPVRRRTREEELQQTVDELARFQTQMWSQGGLAEQKEQELMQPVFDEIDAVIRDIAEGQGFHLIFDASAGGLLFGHIDMDLTRQAMDKLGIEPPPE
jgi:Skp family chaperone for outer membrane proteins